MELAGTFGNPLTVNYNGLALSSFDDMLFGPGGHATLDVSNTSGTFGLIGSGSPPAATGWN